MDLAVHEQSSRVLSANNHPLPYGTNFGGRKLWQEKALAPPGNILVEETLTLGN